MAAVRNGTREIVQLILDHGADPNLGPIIDTPLMTAAFLSRISIAEMLLEIGAEADAGCPPPIIFAVWKEDMDMFRLLRGYGAKLDTPETGGWAMAMAQFYGLESMVDVLVQEGVEKDTILCRCPSREEKYHVRYLFPQNGLDDEEYWLSAVEQTW